MRPTYGNLRGCLGKSFVLNNIHAARMEGQGVYENSKSIALAISDGGLTLSQCNATTPNSGMWVCYAAKQATYGFAEVGQTWAASGPFSGCQMFVGTKGGKVYLAHISVESGSPASGNWRGRGWTDDTTWAQFKVPLPSQEFYSASHVFVDWSDGANPKSIKIVRVDVQCRTMGGTDGEIFAVDNMTT